MVRSFLSPGMQAVLISIGWFAGGYLLGSIPVAWLICRWITGRDLRRQGSGNVGVMNTALSVARWAGLLVFSTEIAKGILAAILPSLLEAREFVTGLTVVAAVIGTRWPIWLGFKGGRGNTVGIAACSLISYQSILTLIAIWIFLRWLVKGSFVATRVMLISLPFVIWLVTRSPWFTLTGLVLSLIYLNAQRSDRDDHIQISERWGSFWDFLTSPPRR